jgi:hypothetical protein
MESTLNYMAAEKKNGSRVETHVADSTKTKFERKCKKNKTTMAQVLRDFIQSYNKS